MVDELYDRNYQASRADLNAGLDRAFSTIARELGKSFAAIHQFEWSAPWTPKSKDAGCA